MKKIIIALTLALSSPFAVAKSLDIAGVQTAMFNADYFQAKKSDFRFVKLETALKNHDTDKPQDWDTLVSLVSSQPTDYEKVALANLIANQIPYVDGTDGSYFHPLKGMKRGGVVCKDYAVFKYLLLKEAGYEVEKMALLIHQSVVDPESGAHVVLVIDIDDELYIANQFWTRIANNFYKTYGINKNKFSKEIKDKGVEALKVDFDIESEYSKQSLTKLKDYAYKDRIVYSIVNELGVMSESKFRKAVQLKKLEEQKRIREERKLAKEQKKLEAERAKQEKLIAQTTIRIKEYTNDN